ncbi:hypothetical protein [Salinisphaera aquimarina]|uniref:Uncharacterized protein n=1 Tax=Salinisphaera aquimarina TaxID=2094031 RepID=A0ABV7ES87_9GAMM
MLEALAHLSLAFEELPDGYVFQWIAANAGSLKTLTIGDTAMGGSAVHATAFGSG